MSLLRVAIVGRPNVGKSSLLNMLAGAKVSIVDPTPGVTRDRVSAVVEVPPDEGDAPPILTEVIDTGGFGVYVAEGARFNDIGEDLTALTPGIERQIGEAVASSDVVLFVIDAQAGVVASDHEFAQLLREGSMAARAANPPSPVEASPRHPLPPGERKHQGPKIIIVANKVDDSSWEGDAQEGAALGFGEPLMVSAGSNYLRRDFVGRLHGVLEEAARARAARGEDEATQDDPSSLRVAIIGKRNAGKSTFVNALAGEDRVIASEIAGTTRDAVDVRIERDGKVVTAIDTAGFRKKKSMADQVEWWAYDRMRRAILRADVCLLLLDATTPISQVDQQLSQEIQGNVKPCVIVVNKWDLAEGQANPKGKRITTDDYRAYIDKELKGLDYCPIAFTSATRGAEAGGAWAVIDLAFELRAQSKTRVGTGELNRLMKEMSENLPASKLGRKLRVFYAAQIAESPPTIALVVNDPGLWSPQAERYMLNRIREHTPFAEVPVSLVVRGRRKEERDATRRAIRGGQTPDEARKTAAGATGFVGVEGISPEEFENMDLSADE